jgi:hypothetical protein
VRACPGDGAFSPAQARPVGPCEDQLYFGALLRTEAVLRAASMHGCASGRDPGPTPFCYPYGVVWHGVVIAQAVANLIPLSDATKTESSDAPLRFAPGHPLHSDDGDSVRPSPRTPWPVIAHAGFFPHGAALALWPRCAPVRRGKGDHHSTRFSVYACEAVKMCVCVRPAPTRGVWGDLCMPVCLSAVLACARVCVPISGGSA